VSVGRSAPVSHVRGGSKRDLILREAAKSLNVRGVADTSLADIARNVGVTRAALYYYFEDQEDLVFQCYRHTCEILARQLNDAAGRGGDTVAIIGRFIDACTDPNEPETATLCEVAYLSDDNRNTIVGLYEGLIARLSGMLMHGAERGELRRCDPRIAAMALIGVVSWIPLQERWITSTPFSHTDLARAAKGFILDGVAADRGARLDYEPLELSPPDLPQRGVFDGAAMASAKQEVLLAAASWLFNLKGVDATSLDEIAARVGVTKKVIYHNIGGKEVLLVACYLRSLNFAISMAERAGQQEPAGLKALCALMHSHAEARLREDIAPLSGPGGLEYLPLDAVEAINDAGVRLYDAAEALYLGGRDGGFLRDQNIGAFLLILPGLVEWVPKWLCAETVEQRYAIGRELAEFCAFGLRSIGTPSGGT